MTPRRAGRPFTRVVAALCAWATPSLGLPVEAHAQAVVYYHLDTLGSVRAVTNSNAQVIERHDYYPFGEECTTGPCATNPGAGAGQPKHFTGKERDKETGLDYFGARYYGSRIGRFTTVDPVLNVQRALVDPQQWNRYSYVHNRPLSLIDPDGKESMLYTYGNIQLSPITGSFGTAPQVSAGRAMAEGAAVGLLQAGLVLGPALAVGLATEAMVAAANPKVRDVVTDIADDISGAPTTSARQGIYEFPDQAAGRLPYVGQSGNLPKRLGDHLRAGRLEPGTEATKEVLGGKTAREIAEHTRIREITGGVPASKSAKVSNKVDPIGPLREHLLKE